ncbi:MAG: hypothetical protein MUE60_11815 [Candidatus Eisenbacteria bacterium]|jgi:hypothetical protein|nr:hypothetical protein [Candidatus Eisenbacteria bacterium]
MRDGYLKGMWALVAAVAACGHGTGKLDGMLAEGRIEDALRKAEECLVETPGRLECLAARAQALDGMGRTGDAAEAWYAVLRAENGHGVAWERLVAYADRVPAPAFGVELLDAVAQPEGFVPADRRQIWARLTARADSILSAAGSLGEAAEWGDAAEALRYAVRTDGGRAETRGALCGALLSAAARGETAEERSAPLREVLALCGDGSLMPSVRERLKEHMGRASTLLEHEKTSLTAAQTYKPWPGARFDAFVDTSSYYPRVQFRCDETKYADIAIDFSAQDPQYSLVVERVSLLQYPRAGSPSAGAVVVKGSPFIIVLAEHGDYRLVSVGGLRGWISTGSVAERHRFTTEIRPRGSMELRARPARAHIRVDVDGMNVFRGDVDLKPYVSYRWSF